MPHNIVSDFTCHKQKKTWNTSLHSKKAPKCSVWDFVCSMRSMIYREEVHVHVMVTVVRDELSTSHKLKKAAVKGNKDNLLSILLYC